MNTYHFEGAPNVGVETLTSGSVRLRWQLGGKARNGTCKTRAEANATALDLQARINEEKGERKRRKTHHQSFPRRCTIVAATALWEPTVAANSRIAHGLYTREVMRCTALAIKFGGVEYVDDITEQTATAIIEQYNKEDSNYGYKMVGRLKRFLRFCKSRNIIVSDDYFAFLDFKCKDVIKYPHRVLTEQQLSRAFDILTAPNLAESAQYAGNAGYRGKRRFEKTAATKDFYTRQYLYPPVQFMRLYAQRPEAIVSLRVGDWDPVSRKLRFKSEYLKTEQRASGAPTERELFIDEHTAKLLTQCAGGRPADCYLFVTQKNRKWKSAWLCTKYARVMRAAGLDTTLYDLRHTRATELYDRYRGKMPLVQAVLGHSSKTTTALKYIKIADDLHNLKTVAEDYSRGEEFVPAWNRDQRLGVGEARADSPSSQPPNVDATKSDDEECGGILAIA